MFTLIGFCAFVVCHSFCPMNTGVMAMEASDHAEHAMHMAHHDMQQGSDASECDNCEEKTVDQLALTKSETDTGASGTVVAFVTTTVTIPPSSSTGVPPVHLTAAGPPVAPDIVRTIVLRT